MRMQQNQSKLGFRNGPSDITKDVHNGLGKRMLITAVFVVEEDVSNLHAWK